MLYFIYDDEVKWNEEKNLIVRKYILASISLLATKQTLYNVLEWLR